MKLGEAAYRASQEEAGDGATGGDDATASSSDEGTASNDENVVDADFEEVDDDKRNKSA